MSQPDVVTNLTDFSNAMTLDLNDDEIKIAGELVLSIRKRYVDKWRFMSFTSFDQAANQLEMYRDEISTTLAERLGVLVTVDTAPVLDGEPPIVEFIGKIEGTQFATHGMDHEKKTHEVRKANSRGEDYYGQKGPEDGKLKRRDKNESVQRALRSKEDDQ